MRKIFVVLILGFLAAAGLHRALARATQAPPPPADPRRIVTLAPSVTETVYAIGLGSRVVGVTQFCLYPPEVLAKPKVAGFSEVNFEALVRLKPDLVILPVDKQRNKSRLERLGLPVMTLDTRSLDGLKDALIELGQNTGHSAEARAVRELLDKAIDRARLRAEGRARPRVLFSVMHSYEGLGYITEINAVGRDGFFSELIEIAGGENAYQGALAFPRLSREAIIFLNPDIIIDVIYDIDDLEPVRRDWLSLASVAAVKNGRVHFLTDQADTVPGPRIHLTLDKLSEAFHPLVPGEADGPRKAEDYAAP